MKLQATCPCGGTFMLECDDNARDTILSGTAEHRKWLDEHKGHKASPIKEFFGASCFDDSLPNQRKRK